MADGKIQTPFSEITSPGGLKCQEFGGRRGFEERHRYQDSSRISGSSRNRLLCTGTADDGTTTTLPLGGADPDGDGVSECTATTINTTTATLSGRTRDTSDSPRYLALSGVFRVAAAPVVLIESVEITSDSGGDKDYEAGDEIEITVTFSEAVAVTGTPRLKIKLNGTRMAEYVGSGSTAADLVFSLHGNGQGLRSRRSQPAQQRPSTQWGNDQEPGRRHRRSAGSHRSTGPARHTLGSTRPRGKIFPRTEFTTGPHSPAWAWGPHSPA